MSNCALCGRRGCGPLCLVCKQAGYEITGGVTWVCMPGAIPKRFTWGSQAEPAGVPADDNGEGT